MKAIAYVLGISTLLVVIGCQKTTSNPEVPSSAEQSQEAKALARDYLDKILGQPGGSSEWQLSAKLDGGVWIVSVPDDVAPPVGGLPLELRIDIEKNTVAVEPSG